MLVKLCIGVIGLDDYMGGGFVFCLILKEGFFIGVFMFMGCYFFDFIKIVVKGLF